MPRPNVLLICVDHWSGRLIGALGHPTVLTPTLNEIISLYDMEEEIVIQRGLIEHTLPQVLEAVVLRCGDIVYDRPSSILP